MATTEALHAAEHANVGPATAAAGGDPAGPTRADRAKPEYIEAARPQDQPFEHQPSEDEVPIYPGGPEREEVVAQPSSTARGGSQVGADLACLVLRCAVGALLVVRGSQELFGWFGGQGGMTLAAQLQELGYHSVTAAATAVGVIEVGIGLLLIVGLLTEWACGGLLALSVVAVLAQHRLGAGLLSRPSTGLGADLPGLEVVGGLGVLAVVLALFGAGRLSLDRNRIWSRFPLITALVALVVGAGLGVLLIQPQLA